jgi:hypothetical protein
MIGTFFFIMYAFHIIILLLESFQDNGFELFWRDPVCELGKFSFKSSYKDTNL